MKYLHSVKNPLKININEVFGMIDNITKCESIWDSMLKPKIKVDGG